MKICYFSKSVLGDLERANWRRRIQAENLPPRFPAQTGNNTGLSQQASQHQSGVSCLSGEGYSVIFAEEKQKQEEQEED